MNKKFSTLAASLLLASTFGSNVFAEKLVKAAPVSGKSYQIITDELSGKTYALGVSEDGKAVAPVLSNDAITWKFDLATNSPWWNISADGKYMYKDAANNIAGLTEVAADKTNVYYTEEAGKEPNVMAFTTGGDYFGLDLVGKQIALGTTNKAKLYTQAWAYEADDNKVAADGGKLLLTSPAKDQNVYIVLGGKYLYVDTEDANKVKLVDPKDIDWNDYGEIKKAVWNVSDTYVTNGSLQFSSIALSSTNFLNLSANGFSLTSSAAGLFFDEADYQGLKGAALVSKPSTYEYFMGDKGWMTIAEIEADKDIAVTDAPEALLYQAPEIVEADYSSASAAIKADFLEGHNVTDGSVVALSADGKTFITMSDENGTLGSKVYTTSVSDENALWTVNIDKNAAGKTVYSFTNLKYGKTLAVSKENSFHATTTPGYTLGITLYASTNATANQYIKITNGTVSLAAVGDAAKIGFYRPGRIAYKESELNAQLGNGFDMSIFVSKKDKDSEILGTANFLGVIKADDAKTADNTNYGLFIADKRVVLSKEAWSSKNTELMGKKSEGYRGLKFDLIDTKDYDATKHYGDFTIYKPIAGDKDQIIVHVNGDINADLYVVEVDGTYYLTVAQAISEKDGEVWPYVVFGSNGRVGDEILTGYVNIEYVTNKQDAYSKTLNGQVLGLKQGDLSNDYSVYSPYFYNASRVQMSKPEGQWAVRRTVYKDTKGKEYTTEGYYTFANREHPVSDLTSMVLYKTGVENVYAVVAGNFVGDTLRITPVETAPFDGYVNKSVADTRDLAYTISIANDLTDAYLYEKHSDKHALALTTESENATEWRVVVTDTAYVESLVGKIEKDAYKVEKDTLFVPVYSLVNLSNEEELGVYYDVDDYNFLACNGEMPIGIQGWNNVTRFAFKEIGDNLNMLAAAPYYVENKISNYSFDVKAYAAVSSNEMRTEGMYKESDNDLIVLNSNNAAEYRSVAMGDTISIFRDENPSQILNENGKYLSILNEHQFDLNPAMFVDTAYVDRTVAGVKNNRPQYLLVVNPDRRKLDHECGVPGHPQTHTDTLYGRFLVNLMDSAIFHKEVSQHKTDFLKKDDTDNYRAKLGFVPGFHTGDSLYLQINGRVDTLNLATADFNVSKFAFRYENVGTESFKIQTAYKPYAMADKDESDAAMNNNGYLKWINDVLVVTESKNAGDVFNMTENYEGTPTANEGVAVSEVTVSTIDGAVVVKGAEGKSVVITNVLGQQIANTVVTSSEATISAPAGVVVVAVEGEAAVKAIVK